MDKSIRNTLSNVVTKCRKILEESVAEMLQGTYGIHLKGKIEEDKNMVHLTLQEMENRQRLTAHFRHIKSYGIKDKDAVEQLIREISFTHLNRLVAYKMLEERKFIREAVSRGINSKGFMFYLADHKDDELLWKSGKQFEAYENFLEWLGASLSDEVRALFSTDDPANFLFPSQIRLEQVIDLLNTAELKDIWIEDETIGWVYQYFTPKELRKKAREESSAPRNSYELAFRNQFYTPRYVVEFLTDNTLGRTWFEMNQGITSLKCKCQYMVRRPDEVFLTEVGDLEETHKLLLEGTEETFPPFDEGREGFQRVIELAHCVNAYNRNYSLSSEETGKWHEELCVSLEEPENLNKMKTQELMDFLFITARVDRFACEGIVDEKKSLLVSVAQEIRRRVLKSREEDLSQEELLNLPHFIQHRPKKDPRDLKILDPACGSGHFLLYCFDLLMTIYDEAYDHCVIAGSEGTKQSLPFSETKKSLCEDYPDKDEFLKAVPGLILRYNLHGIDIDPRAVQIASLALWMRSQKACNEMGIKSGEREKIRKSNIVVAEPMPGEEEMLKEFTSGLKYKVLGHMVEFVFEKMKLAGEAGSLLKIEEDIRDEIAETKKEWEKHYKRAVDKKGNILLFTEEQFDDLLPVRQMKLDLSDITDEEFWESAEEQVLKALREYAAKARNGKGFQRKLFAEDAERGFGFIDVLRKRYDVVLMNPPFGLSSLLVQQYCNITYSNWSKNLAAAFVVRANSLLIVKGLIGVVTDRTILIKNSYEEFRRINILNALETGPIADLGWDVLDANVEVSSVVFEISQRLISQNQVFIDLRQMDTKNIHLLESIKYILKGEFIENLFLRIPKLFGKLPNAVLGYDIPEFVIHWFNTFPSLCEGKAKALVGHQIKMDVYGRLRWEVKAEDIGSHSKWSPMYNGGQFCKFYMPLFEVVRWNGDGEHLKLHPSTRWVSAAYQQKAGIGYGKRGEILDAHILPEGHIFTVEGLFIFPERMEEIWFYLGIMNSPLSSVILNYYCGQHKHVGYVNLLPIPLYNKENIQHSKISELAFKIWNIKRNADSSNELSPMFKATWFNGKLSNIAKEKEKLEYLYSLMQKNANLVEKNIEKYIEEIYGLKLETHEKYIKEKNSHLDDVIFSISGFLNNQNNIDSQFLVSDILAYYLGIQNGRWDIRISKNITLAPDLPGPFDPLPVCPPGMLINPVGLPASKNNIVSEDWLRSRPNAITLPPEGSVKNPAITDDEYPIPVKWDGIIVDDEEHPDDIIVRIREVLKYLWEENAESIEREACEIMGVKNLREYFRKLGKGGFWDDHVKRYSKSRRKAPIYWLLQSSGKNYGLWIYYHRLDKNIFLNARDKYVIPKIRREESRLNDLKSKKLTAGVAGSEAKKLEKELAKQEDFISELRDFHDKLDKVCNMYLEPDLDDGVIINIAPLWELVPWNDAKKCWEELKAGKNEWSSMSKHLKAKGII